MKETLYDCAVRVGQEVSRRMRIKRLAASPSGICFINNMRSSRISMCTVKEDDRLITWDSVTMEREHE